MAADKLIGFCLIVISLVIFVYYSIWVLILVSNNDKLLKFNLLYNHKSLYELHNITK